MIVILRMASAFTLQIEENDMGDSLRGPGTVPTVVFNLAANQLIQRYQGQALPGNREKLERARQWIGIIKWSDLDRASIVRNIEASRINVFSPVVCSLVLVVIGVAGIVFVEMLAVVKAKL